MAATLTQERFTGPEWIFERKLDGIRLLTYKRGSDVRLFSRNRLPLNDAYPDVVRAVAELPVHDLVLDGEATGHWGKPARPATTSSTSSGTTGASSRHCRSKNGARCSSGCRCGHRSSAWPRSMIRSHGSAPAPKAGKG